MFSEIPLEEIKEQSLVELVDREVKRLNKIRANINVSALNEEEIKEVRVRISKGSIRQTTSIDLLMKKLKLSRTDTNYEIVRSLLKESSMDETFCPQGNPVGMRKMVKILKDSIVKKDLK
jgi:hypothetical protein